MTASVVVFPQTRTATDVSAEIERFSAKLMEISPDLYREAEGRLESLLAACDRYIRAAVESDPSTAEEALSELGLACDRFRRLGSHVRDAAKGTIRNRRQRGEYRQFRAFRESAR